MLKQIKYFQAVVRNNSFSEAAAECYISQSAISQQIQALERELGVTLLKRENRRFTLTTAGEHFYRQSLVLTADLERLCRETVRIDRGDDLTLRIGYLKNYGGEEFKRAVSEFTAAHPDVQVDMIPGNHEDLYELLRTDSVDMVLNDQRRAFSTEYVNTILTTLNCYIEISVINPISNMGYVNIGDLRRTPCILIAPKEQRDHEQSYYRDDFGIESPFIFAENLDEARLMVVGGKGYMPIEGGTVPASFADALIRLPLCRNDEHIQRNYCAFRKVGRADAYAEEFETVLKAQFR